MDKLAELEPKSVFKYFEEISHIPRGSGNMEKISAYCMEFAKKHSLKAVCDDANNVIIYKNGTEGYEKSEPVILQGHLDMVCQKTENKEIDFEKDGIDIKIEGNYITADGTSLGADNGIAVAMIFAILESDSIPHPPIEAVLTADEEIGMIGAGKLSFEGLKGKKMINIDAEESETITVSCAGGRDFVISLPINKVAVKGTKISLEVKGLKGGHSGVEINSGRVNADILMGRILNFAQNATKFDIVSIDGGEKSNAIPNFSRVCMVVDDAHEFVKALEVYIKTVKKEILDREPGFDIEIKINGKEECLALDKETCKKLIFLLNCVPNGVQEMSVVIENLVESSLNLGILKTEEEQIILHFALRSNKVSAIDFMEEKLCAIASFLECKAEVFGSYPPWEFNENSKLQKLYKEKYAEKFGTEPLVVAIHAGLECGVFSDGIKDLDCIAIGPELKDVHTVNEKLNISSTQEIFDLILNVLKECK